MNEYREEASQQEVVSPPMPADGGGNGQEGEPCTFAQMFADLVMRGDNDLADVEVGEDDDSQAFAAAVRQANQDWQPEEIARVPAGWLPNVTRADAGARRGADARAFAVAVRRRSRVSRPREGRTSRRARVTRAGPGGDDPPEPGGDDDLSRVGRFRAAVAVVSPALGWAMILFGVALMLSEAVR